MSNLLLATGKKANLAILYELRDDIWHCEMKLGSVVFFHCNTSHTSAPHELNQPRLSFIVYYNAADNPALNRSLVSTPCPVGYDDGILKFV